MLASGVSRLGARTGGASSSTVHATAHVRAQAHARVHARTCYPSTNWEPSDHVLFAGDPTSSGPVQLAIQVRVAKLTPADEVSGTAGGRGPGLKCRVGQPSANCIVTGRNAARAGELQSWASPAVSPQTVKSTKSCRWRLSSPALLAWCARPGCPLAGCVRGQRARARPNAVIGITATSTWPAKRPAHRRRFKPREYTYTGVLYPVISLLPN